MRRMTSASVVIFGSAALLVVLCLLVAWLQTTQTSKTGAAPLLIYCGAGIRAPIEATAAEYEKEHGVHFTFRYGPSQVLLVQAELGKDGDIFVPGDDGFIALARKKGLIDQSAPLGRMTLALAVGKGNPKRIGSVQDLLRADVKLALPSPDAAAAGKLAREVLQASGDWEKVQKNAAVFKGTVHEVANDVRIGAADAGEMWDVVAKPSQELEIVPIRPFVDAHALVTGSTLANSSQLIEARQFLRYLAASDKGLRAFRKFGFESPATGLPRDQP
jgi:molybdate transport system substrate-binding protein